MIKIKEIPVRDYLTATKIPASDYVINPYVGCPHKCMYCYAEFMKRFTNHSEPRGTFLDMKICDKKLSEKKLSGKKVNLSSVTDAYNIYEEKYRITRRIMEQLSTMENTQVSVLTKSNLVVRDIDLFKKMKDVNVAFSMNTLDDKFRKDMEPFASSVSERIEALMKLKSNGIKTSVFLSPMFPGITDFKEIIEATKDFVDDFWFENLNLYPNSAKKILKYISIKHPELYELYKGIYVDKIVDYWSGIEQEIVDYCEENKIKYIMYFYHDKIKKR